MHFLYETITKVDHLNNYLLRSIIVYHNNIGIYQNIRIDVLTYRNIPTVDARFTQLLVPDLQIM